MTDQTTKTEDARFAALMQAAKPARDAAREAALLERIVAAAERTPRLVAAGEQRTHLVSAPAVEPTRVTPVAADQRAKRPWRARRDLWGAGGLLAASLVLGVMLGQSTYGVQTATRLEQATGFTLATASQDVLLSLALSVDEDE